MVTSRPSRSSRETPLGKASVYERREREQRWRGWIWPGSQTARPGPLCETAAGHGLGGSPVDKTRRSDAAMEADELDRAG
jgi:hypothetical protein